MTKKVVEFENETFNYDITKDKWQLSISKSQTRINDINQFKLITEKNDYTVPMEVSETNDEFELIFTINENKKLWKDIKKLPRNEKLRAVNNVTKLFAHASTRITTFIHPDNLVFDENLMPQVIYRGIRGFVFPFELHEDDLLKQYKCFILSLFNEKLSFDELYNGALERAGETEFQRQVVKTGSIAQLQAVLDEHYQLEQAKSEKSMRFVPKRRFTLYKQLTIWFILLTIVFLIPLSYMFFIKSPYQNKLLKAHREFLATDYVNVIQALQKEDIDKLPHPAKYILAYSFIKVEKLSDKQKDSIMKNINLKSDASYLKYWIYNGNGDFDDSIDIAKYMDDPQLIIYGLIKKMEQVKNEPGLSGAERDEQAREIQDELDKYNEAFELDIEEELELEETDREPSEQSDYENDPSEEVISPLEKEETEQEEDISPQKEKGESQKKPKKKEKTDDK